MEPWTFTLHREYRNKSMFKLLKDTSTNVYSGPSRPVTLSPGTALAVDRIYIRQNNTEYDSITFRLLSCPGIKVPTKESFGKKSIARFWVKLAECNGIEIEVEPE